MKRTLLLVLLFLITLGHVFSQNKDYAQSVIDTLCSHSFYGRGYVNRGDSLASEFIRQEYERIGLSSVNNDFFQTFTHNVNVFPGEMRFVFDESALRPGYDFLVDPASGPANGKLDFVELLPKEIITSSWLEKIKKSKSKAVGIDMARVDSLGDRDKKKVREFIEYLKFENSIPSKSILIFNEGKQPWSVSSNQAYRSVINVFKDSIDSFPESIRIDIEAEYIENYRSKNVIGYIRGTENPDSILVVCAHYDHLGMMGKDAMFPGANDNASGTALLLDLANFFQSHPPKYSIYFIAFAAEEAGLLGSQYFVQNPLFDLSRIKFLVNLDLAGTGIDGITVVNGKIFPQTFDRLVTLNDRHHYLKTVSSRGEACNSDHCPFYQKGVKCFFIYTLGGTKYYHDLFDDSETLELNEYSNYFSLVRDFLLDIE